MPVVAAGFPIAAGLTGGAGLSLAASAGLFLGSTVVQNYLQNRAITRQQDYLVKGLNQAEQRHQNAHKQFSEALTQYEPDKRQALQSQQQRAFAARAAGNRGSAQGFSGLASGTEQHQLANQRAQAAAENRAAERAGYIGELTGSRRRTENEGNTLARALTNVRRENNYAQGDIRLARTRAQAYRPGVLHQALGAGAQLGQLYGGYKLGQNIGGLF